MVSYETYSDFVDFVYILEKASEVGDTQVKGHGKTKGKESSSGSKGPKDAAPGSERGDVRKTVQGGRGRNSGSSSSKRRTVHLGHSRKGSASGESSLSKNSSSTVKATITSKIGTPSDSSERKFLSIFDKDKDSSKSSTDTKAAKRLSYTGSISSSTSTVSTRVDNQTLASPASGGFARAGFYKRDKHESASDVDLRGDKGSFLARRKDEDLALSAQEQNQEHGHGLKATGQLSEDRGKTSRADSKNRLRDLVRGRSHWDREEVGVAPVSSASSHEEGARVKIQGPAHPWEPTPRGRSKGAWAVSNKIHSPVTSQGTPAPGGLFISEIIRNGFAQHSEKLKPIGGIFEEVEEDRCRAYTEGSGHDKQEEEGAEHDASSHCAKERLEFSILVKWDHVFKFTEDTNQARREKEFGETEEAQTTSYLEMLGIEGSCDGEDTESDITCGTGDSVEFGKTTFRFSIIEPERSTLSPLNLQPPSPLNQVPVPFANEDSMIMLNSTPEPDLTEQHSVGSTEERLQETGRSERGRGSLPSSRSQPVSTAPQPQSSKSASSTGESSVSTMISGGTRNQIVASFDLPSPSPFEPPHPTLPTKSSPGLQHPFNYGSSPFKSQTEPQPFKRFVETEKVEKGDGSGEKEGSCLNARRNRLTKSILINNFPPPPSRTCSSTTNSPTQPRPSPSLNRSSSLKF